MLTFFDDDGTEIQAYDHRPGAGIIRVPRGVLDVLAVVKPKLEISDLRTRPSAPKLAFAKTLRDEQEAALAAMIKHEQGQIIAPPGKGKTEIALAFAAVCRTPTLVVVHTRDLFQQWQERIKSSVPGATIGDISAGRFKHGHITVAMIQTLKRYVGEGRGFWQQWGNLIIDEEHHAASETYEWVVNNCPAYFRFGFTATEKRSDGRHPLVRFYIGPIIHRIKFASEVPMTVQPVYTRFGWDRTVYRGGFD